VNSSHYLQSFLIGLMALAARDPAGMSALVNRVGQRLYMRADTRAADEMAAEPDLGRHLAAKEVARIFEVTPLTNRRKQ
jgi:hypothetical protein